jgi:hypothetical protein
MGADQLLCCYQGGFNEAPEHDRFGPTLRFGNRAAACLRGKVDPGRKMNAIAHMKLSLIQTAAARLSYLVLQSASGCESVVLSVSGDPRTQCHNPELRSLAVDWHRLAGARSSRGLQQVRSLSGSQRRKQKATIVVATLSALRLALGSMP